MALIDNGDGTFGFDVSNRMYALSRMRLLDAAPDLLEALQSLMPLAEWATCETSPPDIDRPLLDKAYAAISKALGENK